jgi:hypothetical protein
MPVRARQERTRAHVGAKRVPPAHLRHVRLTMRAAPITLAMAPAITIAP